MFRFAIRDILWLTMACALTVSWWSDRQALGGRYADSEAKRQVLEVKLARAELLRAEAEKEAYEYSKRFIGCR
jgi:hypothetical protein